MVQFAALAQMRANSNDMPGHSYRVTGVTAVVPKQQSLNSVSIN